MNFRAFCVGVGATVAVLAWLGRPRPADKRLHDVNSRGIMDSMYASTDRLVLVPAALLDDQLELSRLAADRLPEHDPLRLSLVGATAAVRSAALPEP